VPVSVSAPVHPRITPSRSSSGPPAQGFVPMDGSMMAGGAASMSPTSPVSSRHGHAHGNSNGTNKRKRSSMVGIESSPGSNLDDHDAEQEKKRQPGVKRACNECRQQKVSQNPENRQSRYHCADHNFPIAPMRRGARPFPKLLSVQSTETRVQN
jgi:hypothetical protein